MFDASIEPSAAPAPMTVCISSMKRINSSDAPRTSSTTAFRRSSNSPRYFVPAIIPARSSAITRLPAKRLGHLVVDDALRDPLDEGRLADAGLPEQGRVVLRAAREDLDRLLDLVRATDDRIELALACLLRQVAAELVELRRLARLARAAARLDAADHGTAELRVRDTEALEQLTCVRLRVAGEREEHVLRPDVRRAELAGLLVGGEQRGFRVGRERRCDVRALGALRLLLDLRGDRVGIGVDLPQTWRTTSSCSAAWSRWSVSRSRLPQSSAVCAARCSSSRVASLKNCVTSTRST